MERDRGDLVLERPRSSSIRFGLADMSKVVDLSDFAGEVDLAPQHALPAREQSRSLS